MPTALLGLGTIYAANEGRKASKDAAKISSQGSLQAREDLMAAGGQAAVGLRDAFYGIGARADTVRGAPNNAAELADYEKTKARYAEVSKQVNALEAKHNVFNFKEKNPGMKDYLEYNSKFNKFGQNSAIAKQAAPLLSEYNALRAKLDTPEFQAIASRPATASADKRTIPSTPGTGGGAKASGIASAGGAGTGGGIIDYYAPYMANAQQDYNDYREASKALTPYDFQFDPSQIENNPAYQFRLNQGLEALDRRFAASGMRRSGNRMLGITDYAQGLASTEYENAFNRQKSIYDAQYNSQFDRLDARRILANTGYETTMNLANTQLGLETGIANLRTGIAGSAAGYTQQSADALASGVMGRANAINRGIGQLGYLYGASQGWFK